MSRLTERMWACRALAIQAAQAGQRSIQSGYLAELMGLFDARDGRPCDPFQVASDYMHRYEHGWHDGRTVLLLEAEALVDF